tara:strand:- start:810 stop:1220 length:411 start_codon:yes stop_codon:yes gene_type:complete
MKHQRIEVPVAGGTAWLSRLSPRQMICIGDRLWSNQRKQLIKDLKEAEIESAERIQALRDHERRHGLMSEIITYAITSHGSLEIIKEAASNEHSENGEGLPDNFEGTTEDAMRIALELVGAELSNDSEENKPKKKK